MEVKTFKIYPLDGESFSVKLEDFETDPKKFKPSGNANKSLMLIDDQRIAAIYHPKKPPTDWRLVDDQPRLFKVYLRNHTDSPLEIYAHYFKTLENDTLEFCYKTVSEVTGYAGMKTAVFRDETVADVYIKRSEVVAIVSSEPLPSPPQP